MGIQNGKLTYQNGYVYESEYKDKQPHGKGKFTFIGGNIYPNEDINGYNYTDLPDEIYRLLGEDAPERD